MGHNHIASKIKCFGIKISPYLQQCLKNAPARISLSDPEHITWSVKQNGIILQLSYFSLHYTSIA
mgnify:CR=1 FL=1